MSFLAVVTNSFYGKEASALMHRHACMSACAFLQRVCMHVDRCCEHHACVGVCFRQVFVNISVHICVHACVGAVCSLALGDEDEEVELIYGEHLLLGVGVYF